MKELREVTDEHLRRSTLKRKWAHGRRLKLNSKVYNAAMKLEEFAFADGALSKKHKELIGPGIGVITDCCAAPIGSPATSPRSPRPTPGRSTSRTPRCTT